MLNFISRTLFQRPLLCLPLVLACALLARGAHAASFDLSYTLDSGDLLEAWLQGDLQMDGNTVIITAVDAVAFNGVTSTPFTYFDSVSNHWFTSGNAPVLSLDGSVLDFIGCFTSFCVDGYYYDNRITPTFNSTTMFGFANETVNTSYSFAAKSVPGPASLHLLLAGVLVLVGMRVRCEHPPMRRARALA